MKSKGAKIAVVVFLVLSMILFTLGTVLSVPMLTTSGAENAKEEAGQAIAVILLMAPFLLCYLLFGLLDFICLLLSVHLLKNQAKGMGIFSLILVLAMLTAAVIIVVKILVP